jgi:hypothetical protein
MWKEETFATKVRKTLENILSISCPPRGPKTSEDGRGISEGNSKQLRE